MKNIAINSIITALFILMSGSTGWAQAPDTVWSHIYGNSAAANSLFEMPDGGFVLGGYDVPEGESFRDMYIVRTDANGDTLWTSHIGASDRSESATSLYPTRDGGFILNGIRGQDAPYTSNSDIYLVKADENGDFEWSSIFGIEDQSESGGPVVPAADGGYLLVNSFWESGTGYDLWLLKTNSLGILEWPIHLLWPDADHPTGAVTTRDSGFAITGYTQSFDSEYDYDMFILRMGMTGDSLAAIDYGASSPNDEEANDICATSDGGFLLCGFRNDDSIEKDIYVVKVGSTGIEWTSRLGGTYHDAAYSCIETVDGGYAVAASWYRNGNWQVGLIKYNSVGDTLWTAFWGDPANGHTPYGLVQTADNGYAVGGLMSTGGPTKAFLVKFAPDPNGDPFTTHENGLNTPISHVESTSDTIRFSIPDEILAGRAVIGAKIMLDTLEHPALDELSITLEHGGNAVTLVGEADVSGVNFVGTAFADASPTYLSLGQAPYTGLFQPNEYLSAFDGLDPNGDWILNINDGTSGNDGTLRAWGITLLVESSLGVNDNDNNTLPEEYHISQNYPNPFNPSTAIKFTLNKRSDVTITVFDVLGRKVKTIFDRTMPVGTHTAYWDGTDVHSAPVATGVYFYQIKTADYTESKKMLLLK